MREMEIDDAGDLSPRTPKPFGLPGSRFIETEGQGEGGDQMEIARAPHRHRRLHDKHHGQAPKAQSLRALDAAQQRMSWGGNNGWVGKGRWVTVTLRGTRRAGKRVRGSPGRSGLGPLTRRSSPTC